MAIYKVRSFDRFARKYRIDGEDLAGAARDIFAGRVDADLGGGVFKQRMARNGAGKSGGFRVLVTLRANGHLFFVEGYAKSERSNITGKELELLRALASELGKLTRRRIDLAMAMGELIEVRQ